LVDNGRFHEFLLEIEMTFAKFTAVGLLALASLTTAANAQDGIFMGGSSTVLPFAIIAAESFGENTSFATPVVEGGGTGAGITKFCEGVGANTYDVVNASRKMKSSEVKACKANGVDGIKEVKIGFDGVVFASAVSGPDFELTPSTVYTALAAEVVIDGKLVANPYTAWNQIDGALPAQEIMAFIPGTKHGTREVFDLRVMEAGCKMFGSDKVIKAGNGGDKAATFETCIKMRNDGRVVEIDGDYSETLARLKSNPNGVGVFGFSFYENNSDTLKVARYQGTIPSRENIASGVYNVARPLYIYVKKQHIGVTPGLKEFIEFFVSDDIAAKGGALDRAGLVADPALSKTQSSVASDL
jgi:phosphate transport system substrate-binding protein